MTILQSLDRYYDRMAARGEAEAPGFSREKISFAIVLSPEGEVRDVMDLRVASGRKRVPVLHEVPAAVKRTAGILPNRLWDKTSYVLGRTAGEGRRTAEEHAAFKALHRDLLAGSDDLGLVALARFLDAWDPAAFDAPPFSPEMLDTNIVFRLASELRFIHQREAAKRLLAAEAGEEAGEICLVTGRRAPVQRLHATIKGVEGAQSSGASLVSFNLDAFASYGKEQGANAPTSEAAAFRYGAALNRMLDRASANRLRRPLGDTTVVFWADTANSIDEKAAAAAEWLFGGVVDPPSEGKDDSQEAVKLHDALKKVAELKPVAELGVGVVPGTRFHVLGLAPNAARLAVRYWLEDSIDAFARQLGRHYQALELKPAPRGWKSPPSLRWLLAKTTALQEKFDNVPPLLAGEMTRAVLAGTPYPRTLLAAALIRLRAGDDPTSGWHAAVIKAHLSRQPFKEMLPVALDPDHPSTAYQLGRLFAVLEQAQYTALLSVNASIADRYYGAASATPARVFGPLLRGLNTHISDARKRGRGGWIQPKVQEIMKRLPADLPKTLKLEDQGRFAVGYYHERATRPTKADETETKGDEA
ncbi:type I-C CRISPR-associated protein Cas8c/Csd1 [Methylobacterium sp. ID0610]|uniref:type I-C CRISPR-associated protein Cas8c/Csd1 n=1 Tax=Methylobacterium carpenticola TaxID=3344827 RepID=UPI00368DEE0A